MEPERQEDFRKALAVFPHDDHAVFPATTLLSYHQELWAAFKAWVPPMADAVLATAICWWVVANRQAHAAVTVTGEGSALDAAPNVRAAFEHALGVVWLWREKGTGVLDSLALRWIRDGVSQFEPARRDVPGVEGMLAIVAEMQAANELPSGDIAVAPFKFRWLVEHLPVDKSPSLYYMVLSTLCHPTMAALLAFLQFDAGGMHPNSEPTRPIDAGDPLLWAVQCQCWSGLALDRMLANGLPFRDRLDAIAEAIELPLAAQLFALPSAD